MSGLRTFLERLRWQWLRPALNPGLTAVAALKQGSGCQIPHGCRSKPKSNRRSVSTPPRDSSASRARTRRADHSVAVPDAGLDGPGSPETCGKPDAWLPECPAEARYRAARNAVYHARSRVVVKLVVRSLCECLRLPPQFRFRLIKESAQGRTRARVADDPFPRGIPIQLRQQLRQTGNELLPLCLREVRDSRFDFVDGAHATKLQHRQSGGKLGADLALKRLQRIAMKPTPQIVKRKT